MAEGDEREPVPTGTEDTESTEVTDWPDVIPVQIPGTSSTTQNPEPEIQKIRGEEIYPPASPEVPELEDDSEQD